MKERISFKRERGLLVPSADVAAATRKFAKIDDLFSDVRPSRLA